MQINTIWV